MFQLLPQPIASMKGPFESRHTSSERSAPGSSSHPGARSERVLGSQGRSTIHRSGRLTSAKHLSEPAHADSISGWPTGGVIQGSLPVPAGRMRLVDGTTRGEDIRSYPRGHWATTSLQSTRANATRALKAPLRTARRRAQRPVASVRFIPCIAASTRAQRSHGDPSFVMRP